MGEAVRLNLTFSAKSDQYKLLISSEKTFSDPDEIFLSPSEGAFAWAAQYERGKYFMKDYFGYTKLSAVPQNIEIALNENFRFDKPGKYLVYIKTKRVVSNKNNSAPRNAIPLVSNKVEFEITEMSDAEEREEIKRLDKLIKSKKTWWEQDKFVQDLSFLTGEASTVEKVNKFFNPDNSTGNFQSRIVKGLLMTRNKLQAIELLENALRDVNREVNYNLPYMLAELRFLRENTDSPPKDETDSKKLLEQREARISEILQAYYKELLESLPKRKGKSRLVTAYTIFMQLPREDVSSEAFETTKAILLKDFDELTPHGKDQLLGHYWEKVKTPTLLPSIEKILASSEPVPYWSYRNLALKRLIEFDPKKARPIVIDEIRNPDSRISIEVLGLLNDKFLPEVNDALLKNIRQFAPTKDYRLNMKNFLAARYATKKIYKELMQIYTNYSNYWSDETKILLLAYLVRHNEKEATPLIEGMLDKWRNDKSGSHVFYNLTKINFPNLPKGIEKLLRKRLESDDPGTVDGAAFYLSKYAGKRNIKLLEKRYERWFKEWRNRVAELNNSQANATIRSQAMMQFNLADSIFRAKNNKLSDAESAHLKSMCLTESCRRRFPVK